MATRSEDDAIEAAAETATRSPEGPPAEPTSALIAAEPEILEATRLAWRWHGLQRRKGRDISYMSHLLVVHGLVIQAGGGPEPAIGALLHDSLEDAPDPAERRSREKQIAARFGDAVLSIVLDCTDTTPEEAGASKGPWRERKQRYLEQLSRAGDPSLLVAACDKRHNLGELVSDLRHEGPRTFERFNAGPKEQLWYFASMHEICRPAIPERLAHELAGLVSTLRTFVER